MQTEGRGPLTAAALSFAQGKVIECLPAARAQMVAALERIIVPDYNSERRPTHWGQFKRQIRRAATEG